MKLLDLRGISKSATVLIERIAGGVEGFARPYQIVRVAQAEAKAKIIRAKAKHDVDELQQRASARLSSEELYFQGNLEKIALKSSEYIKIDAQPENIPQEWLEMAKRNAKVVSDDHMQQLWARILAGEANIPGTYSKKTVSLLSYLEKVDAEMFMNLCRCIWYTNNEPQPFVIISNLQQIKTNEMGVSFDDLSHLADLGFVHVGAEMYDQASDDIVNITYFNNTLSINVSNCERKLPTGYVLLTKSGKELSSICSATPSMPYFNNTLAYFVSRGGVLVD